MEQCRGYVAKSIGIGLIGKREIVAKELSPTTWFKDTMLGFYGNQLYSKIELTNEKNISNHPYYTMILLIVIHSEDGVLLL